MKINDISIRGFFIYSETSQYEQGDFVVYGNTIYVCSPKSGSTYVSGEIPFKSNNFYVYLGDQSATRDDFLSFSKNGGGEDKYLSLSTLVDILNTYQKGLDTTGVIGHEYSVIVDEEGTKNAVYKINNVVTETFSEEDSKEILARIFLDKSLNHCIFKVSRDLPEISAINDNSSTTEYCILRQYSYYSDEDNSSMMRVQELIDIQPDNYLETYEEYGYGNSINFANIYYRAAILEESDISSIKDLNWHSATGHTSTLSNLVTNLINTYNDRMKGFETSLKELQGNFCFTRISLPNLVSSFTLQNTADKNSGYININSLSELGPITLNVLTKLETNSNENIYKNNALTIDVLQGPQKYYIDDDLYLLVRLNGVGGDDFESKFTYFNSSRLDFSIPVGFGSINVDESGNYTFTGSTLMLSPNNDNSSYIQDNITLNTSGFADNTTPKIISYYIFDQSQSGGLNDIERRTVIYKPDGSLSPESGKKYFDFGRKDNSLVFYSSEELVRYTTPIISFTPPEFNASIKVENTTLFDIYFPAVGVNEDRFKISSGETNYYENSILSGLSDRGIYLYAKRSDLPENLTIKFSIINIENDKTVIWKTTNDANLTTEIHGEYTYWGTYENPMFSFDDIISNLKRTLRYDLKLIIEDISSDENEERSSTFSLRGTAATIATETNSSTTTSTTSTTTTTTPAPSSPTPPNYVEPENPTEEETTTPSPTTGENTVIETTPLPPENPPILNIDENITSVELRLSGIKARNSWISSAYCRKYFKN